MLGTAYSRWRKATAGLCIGAVLSGLAPGFAPKAALAQSTTERFTNNTEFRDCARLEESQFRTELQANVTVALTGSLEDIDFQSMVNREWESQRIGRVLDASVDQVVADIKKEEGYLKRLFSNYSPSSANEFADTMVKRVFEGDEFTAAFERFAASLAGSIGSRINRQIDAAAVRCVQSFLSYQYTDSVANVMTSEIETNATETLNEAGDPNVAGSVARVVAGVSIVVMRRVLARVVSRIIRRIAGRIVARFAGRAVPYVGWALVLYDLIKPNGAIDSIGKDLKAERTKRELREGIAEGLAQDLRSPEEVSRISAEITSTIYGKWQSFKSDYRQVLELSQTHPEFKRLLADVQLDYFATFSQVIVALVAEEGADGVLKRLERGELDAITRLSPTAANIIVESRDFDIGMGWLALAKTPGGDADQDAIARIYRYKLHTVAEASGLTRPQLDKIIALPTQQAAHNVVTLAPDSRARILTLEPAALSDIARALTVSQLESLSHYIEGLSPRETSRLVVKLREKPHLMKRLEPASTRKAILASSDRDKAIDMVTAEGAAARAGRFFDDAKSAISGQVSFWLFLSQHSILNIILAVIVLGFLFFVLRIVTGFFGMFRRKKAKS